MNCRSDGDVMELWKDIPGYEGLYQVSTAGRVRRGDRIKAQVIDRGGYCTVGLSKHSVQMNMKVHRLVALVFIPNPESKKTVNHKDGNKKNNCVDNLEWATHGENLLHANISGLRIVTDAQRKAASNNGKKTCEMNRMRKAVFCTKDGKQKTFASAHDGARFVNGDPSSIIACCKGKKKTYKGFEWGYYNANQ